jgi:hypothetical protein
MWAKVVPEGFRSTKSSLSLSVALSLSLRLACRAFYHKGRKELHKGKKKNFFKGTFAGERRAQSWGRSVSDQRNLPFPFLLLLAAGLFTTKATKNYTKKAQRKISLRGRSQANGGHTLR